MFKYPSSTMLVTIEVLPWWQLVYECDKHIVWWSVLASADGVYSAG